MRVPQAHTVALLYSANRTERRAASQAYTRGLNEQAHQTTFILNMLLEDKAIDDQYRHFEHPEDSRHCTNQIKRETVNTMVSVVIQNYRLVRQYYGLKRKLLGVGALYDYDRYAPYHAHGRAAPKRFSFTEARAIVLRSLANFYPPLAEIGEDFFRKRWIDAASRDGKRAGAFCSHTTSDHHPYLLMNFQGSLADLFTLAHEMGHGIHACLMREQSYLNMEVPLPLAETASVFAEMVVFDYLRAHLKDKHELLALYCGKIENVLATVFRQVSIYRFEQEVHHLRRAEGELSTERLNKLWLKQQQKMFGGSVKLANGYGSWWSAIPHIFHTPFYVYAYAFGELLSLSLYDRYRKACAENLGLKFCERYVRFLRAGNSESGQRLLQPFGVYLDDRKFWEGGMQMITQLIGDVRKLAKGR